MRRAGGTGSITKINNRKLRKPYRVTVTERTFHDEENKKHEVKKLVGYYATQKEATEALEHYNLNKENINLDKRRVKFSDLWEKWLESKTSDKALDDDTIKGYKWAYTKITDNIKNATFIEIQFEDLQNMINTLMKTYNYDTLRKVRTSISQLYDYAIKCNIVYTNYAKLLNIGHSRRKGETVILTDEQIVKLFDIVYLEKKNWEAILTAKIVIMLCFNGLRISEFLDLKTEDVDMDKRIIHIRKSKTDAGVRRVPIHSDLANWYGEFIEQGNEYLLTHPITEKKFTYANFRDSYWDRLMVLLEWENLTPHNCRKTCASKLKYFGVDSTYQKLILGHEGALDLTEKTYTYVSDEQLVEAMDKIKIIKSKRML